MWYFAREWFFLFGAVGGCQHDPFEPFDTVVWHLKRVLAKFPKIESKVSCGHAVLFGAFMLLIFWIFHFFCDISKRKLLMRGAEIIPPRKPSASRKLNHNFSKLFSRIYDRKDSIKFTFFPKKCDFLWKIKNISALNISDRTLLFYEFYKKIAKITISR